MQLVPALKKAAKEAGRCLSVAYRDFVFRVFFCALVAKLLLFTYLNGLGDTSFFPSFGAILSVMAFSLLFESKTAKVVYLSVVNIIGSMLFLVHTLYFRYFDDFASAYDLPQASQAAEVMDVISGMMGAEFLFAADLIILPVFAIWRSGVRADPGRPLRIGGFASMVFLGAYCNVGPFLLNTQQAGNYLGLLADRRTILDRRAFVSHMGIMNYQALDAYYYFSTRAGKRGVSRSDEVMARGWLEGRRSRMREANAMTGIGEGMNLLVIQAESLQAFVIGRKVNGREITPNLNRLAEGGVFFRNIYDQTAAGNTSDAAFMANASLYPARRGSVAFLYPQNTLDTLPRVLKEHGYSTATMHAYRKTFWNRAVFEKALGFDHQFYADSFEKTEEIGGFLRGLSDRAFFRQSAEKIERLPRPFYAFLVTLSSHAPFAHITPEIDGFQLGGLEGEIVGYYIRAMHYLDSAIGEFLGRLSEKGLLSNTVVAIYGDHRARLPEAEFGRIGADYGSENRKVPLIVFVPGRRVEAETGTIGGHIDFAPTMCNIMGVDCAGSVFMGRDLGRGGAGYAVFRDGSFVGALNAGEAVRALEVSDLVLEADLVPALRAGGRQDSQ